MGLTPFPVEFAGLNVAADPVDVGTSAAVDILNVDMGRLGAIRTRPGASKLNSTTPSSTGYLALYGTGTGSPYAGSPPGLSAIRSSGTGAVIVDVITAAGAVTTSTGGGTGTWSVGSCATYDTSGIPTLFFSRWGASTAFTMQQFLLNGFVVPSDVPSLEKPWYVCGWSTQNRLVQGGYFAVADTPLLTNGSASTVFFSDPGALTYGSGAGNFVKLQPGDGEGLTGIVNWRELVFVFKQSTLFVFTGVSQLLDSTPVFNYRAVTLPDVILPRQGSYSPAAVAGPDGVYFACRGGIYRTTGGPPERISDQVRGIFAINDTTIDSAIRSNGNPMALSWVGTKLFVNYTTQAGTSRWLIYDTATGQWTLWAIPSSSGTTMIAIQGRGATSASDYFTIVGNDVHKITQANTADVAGAIAWSYTTGYSNAGGYFRARIISSGERKRHFKTDIEGSGTVTHQVLALNARPGDVPDPGGSVTLGTAPATARGSRRRGVRGTYFAHKLSGTGPAVINGLTYWLANVENDT